MWPTYNPIFNWVYHTLIAPQEPNRDITGEAEKAASWELWSEVAQQMYVQIGTPMRIQMSDKIEKD